VLHLSFYQAKHCVAVYLRRPLGCIKETSSIGSDASTELVTLTITDNSPKPNGSGKGIIGAAKTVTFTFDFSDNEQVYRHYSQPYPRRSAHCPFRC
jgi:hypothetical protein